MGIGEWKTSGHQRELCFQHLGREEMDFRRGQEGAHTPCLFQTQSRLTGSCPPASGLLSTPEIDSTAQGVTPGP